MKIDIPIELNDPIIRIEYTQHDGYYLQYDKFQYSDIPNYGDRVFKTYDEARAALERLEN